MKLIITAIIGLAMISVSTLGHAQPGYGELRQCFFTRQMRGWTDAGRNAIDVRISRREVYRMHLFAPCPELNSALTVGVDPRGGSSSICEGDRMIDLLVRAPGQGLIRCPV